MTGALEKSDQAREAWPHQTGATRRFLQGSIMDLLALATPTRMRAKPDDGDRLAGQEQIDLLKDFGRVFAGHDGPMAIGTFEAVQFDEIDFIVRKRFAQVKLMIRLATDFSIRAILRWFLGGLDQIAGGRLGSVARILLGGGKFRLHLGQPSSEFRKLLFQRVASCARLRPCNGHDAIG